MAETTAAPGAGATGRTWGQLARHGFTRAARKYLARTQAGRGKGRPPSRPKRRGKSAVATTPAFHVGG